MMRRSQALANYVGVGSLYLILIPLLLVGIWGTWNFNDAIRRSIASANDLSARAVSARLEEFLERQGQVLGGIASMLQRPDLYPPGRMDGYISTSLSVYPFLDQIEVIDPGGRIAWAAPYDKSLIGLSRVGDAVYESVKASIGIAWSPSYISLKHNAPAVSFGSRVDGYVILCDLNLSSILRFATPSERSANYEISVTDENGVLLSNEDVLKVERREHHAGFAEVARKAASGSGFEVSIGGRAYLVSLSRVKNPAWFVIILYEASHVDEILRRYSLGFVAIIVFSATIGFLISRYRVRKIDRALKHLASKAARISEGLYDELVEFGEGFLEFERVGEKFNGMISGIKRREALLLDRERGFRQILENIRLFALGINREGRVTFANSCFLEATGYARQELDGQELDMVLAPRGASAPSMLDFLIAGGSPGSTFECLVRPKQGEVLLVEWTVTASHDATGAMSGITGIGTDITAKRAQSERLQTSLGEKEILLKEVHHRVKNNMQLISSLLSLQRQEAKDGAAETLLENAQNRIRSISLVHELLYDSEDFGSIDFGGYAQALTREILQGRDGERIDLRQDIQAIGICLNEAVPCGLILNEALTNIRKYAFPPGWGGLPCVELSLMRAGSDRAILRVRDNGVGLPLRYDPATSPSLGHTIMRLLALQAEAELEIRSDRGTAVELIFPARTLAVD